MDRVQITNIIGLLNPIQMTGNCKTKEGFKLHRLLKIFPKQGLWQAIKLDSNLHIHTGQQSVDGQKILCQLRLLCRRTITPCLSTFSLDDCMYTESNSMASNGQKSDKYKDKTFVMKTNSLTSNISLFGSRSEAS